MLTSRGWWFLFLAILQTALGLILSNSVGPIIAVIGLVLLLWFTVEWITFQVRVHFAVPRVQIRRRLLAERREVPIVWAGQVFEVVIDVVLHSPLRLPYITFQDRPPSGCDRV